MGVVYRAQADGPPVALKLLDKSADEGLLERFFREGQVGAELDHPDIVRVLDHGVDEGRAWLTMDLLEGYELESAMYEPTFDLEARLSVVVRVASALHYVHEMGLVHRDVKPSNIFLTHEGGVRLLDFGIAYLRDIRLTKTGMLMGTPHYMAPEQLSSGTIDRRADVFALGVVLYRMLTNRFPWDGDTVAQVMFAIATRPHEPLLPAMGHWDFGLEPARLAHLGQIVDRAIASEPSHRYATAFELGAAVEAFLSGAAVTPDAPTGVVDPARIAARRIEWARARAARLALESTDLESTGMGRAFEPKPDEESDRDFGPRVWFGLVVVFAAGLAAALWFAFFDG